MSSVFKSIKPSQIKLNPFKVFKRWYGTSGSVSTDFDSGSLYLKYEGILVQDRTQLSPPFTQANNTTANGKIKGVVYQSVDHLYYRDYYTNTKATFGSGNLVTQDRLLYDFVTVLSLPQSRVGEEILPGSIKLRYAGLLSGSTADGLFPSGAAIIDDSNSNLTYWTNIDATGSITNFYDGNGVARGLPTILGTLTSLKQIDSSNHVYRLETERFTKQINTTPASSSIQSWKHPWPSTTNIINVTPVTSSRGVAMQFDRTQGSQAVITPIDSKINDLYNFRSTDYSIGFIVRIPSGQANHTGLILEKRSTASFQAINEDGSFKNTTLVNGKFPYRFTYYYNNGGNGWQIIFEKCSGNFDIKTTGTRYTQDYIRKYISDCLQFDTDYYILMTRSGNNCELSATAVGNYPSQSFAGANQTNYPSKIISWVDIVDDKYSANDCPIYVGNSIQKNDTAAGRSTMVLEALSMFNKSFQYNSPEHLFQIFSGGKNNLNVGNVYYPQGMLVLTNPTTYERTAPYTKLYPQELEYRSTQTIFETEISCTIGPGEYNFTNNPTAHEYDPVTNEYKLRGFATASAFNPYVTQIGLYDDSGNLLAAGKLNQPLRPPGNVDTTFIVKFDR